MKRIIALIVLVMATGLCLNAQSTATTAPATNAATDSLVACAQAGNDSCQALLGKWIFEGSHGFKKDQAKAVAWWLQAAKQKNFEATSNLGFCYLYGWGVGKDTTIATRLFEKAIKQESHRLLALHDSLASKGSVYSAMFLARCYKMAIGVRRDNQKSLKYYTIAANLGNVEAMREAAILMRSSKDDAKALSMFKQAMQKGDLVATYYYGKMHCEGRGTAKDAVTGTAYLQKAADGGYPAAMYELAKAYDNGIGVDNDAAKAYYWFTKAAAGGNRAAWWEKAERLRLGKGVQMNYEAALDCYVKAYDMGYQNKIKSLLANEDSEWKDTPFLHYLRGLRMLEMDQNPNAALVEFAKLPKQMSVRQTMEAICKVNPKYSKLNLKKGVKNLQQLAQGDQRAAYELAKMQLHGIGMDKNVAKAEKEFTSMANNDYVRAINFLADCYYEGLYFGADKNKAILLYLRAEKVQGLSTVGAVRLAQAFRDGDGMKVNKERAAELEKYKASDISVILELIK